MNNISNINSNSTPKEKPKHSAFSVFGVLLVPIIIGVISGFSESMQNGFISILVGLLLIGMFSVMLYAFKD